MINNPIAASLTQTIELNAVKTMATILLGSEKKELKNITRFYIDDQASLPKGVSKTEFGRYTMMTPDGLAEVKEGDYILETKDDCFYYIRLEKIE